jgi:hypothetical protein
MKHWWPALLLGVSLLLSSEALAVKKEEGMVKIPGHHSVDETVDKLKTILQSKGVTLFALVDHSGEAEKVGLKMPPTKLDLRQSEGRHAADAGFSERSHRPAAEDSGCGRFARKGVDLLQQRRVPERAPRSAAESFAEYRGR